jgi:hypothetical protein
VTASSLVEPAFLTIPDYEFTLGPQVAELCALAGFPPDAQQELGLDIIFARRADKHLAAQDFAVVAPRQNLKTGLFKQAAIGWLWLMDEQLVVWSAHEYSTSVESFEDMTSLVENAPVLKKRLAPHGIHLSTGRESIVLKSGATLKFRARSKTAARGLSAPKIVLDEAHALEARQLGSLLPLILAQQDAQVLYGSSAPMFDSDELRRVCRVGRAGVDSSAGYMEWCDTAPLDCAIPNCDHHPGTDGCSMDDLARWYAANPSLGKRNPLENLQKLRMKLPPAEFGRECLGWWDEAGGKLIDWDLWQALADPGPRPLYPFAFALDATPDRSAACIATAGRTEAGHLGIEVVDHRRGTGWVVARLVELVGKYKPCALVVDPAGPAGSLLSELETAELDVVTVNAREYAQACGQLFDAVAQSTLRHQGDQRLDSAVLGAATRSLGDAWAWARKSTSVDISPLVAVTLALWGYMVHGPESYDVLSSVY